MKETAVEWLINEYVNKNVINIEAIKQALAMEKEQIKNAWLNSLTKGDYNSAEEYYNETFNKKA
jgi:hypothetical protein